MQKRFFAFFHFGAKNRKSAQKPKIPRKNAKFRTFSPFRENELKIPIKGIGFNRPWEPCAFFAFWSEKGGKVRFLRKSAIFREKVQNFGEFRLFGPEITFWAPPGPPYLSKVVRRGENPCALLRQKKGGGYSLLSSPPHLLLSDSPPLTPPSHLQDT